MARTTTDGLKIMDRMFGNDARTRREMAEISLNFDIAQMIYDARTAAKLTQKQLAELIKTKQPVIARLEDADYEGHSLTMLVRVAAALGKRVEIRFVTARTRTRARRGTRRAA
jgi:ribosome-binding protein aMBF1 (putative translation factor)